MSVESVGTHRLEIIGTSLVVIAYIPQMTHLIRVRCGEGLSISAYALWTGDARCRRRGR
jgi:hypothetical protein